MFKKILIYAGVVIAGITTIALANSSPSAPTSPTPAATAITISQPTPTPATTLAPVVVTPAPTQSVAPTPPPTPAPVATPPVSNSSSNDYYTNSDGNQVHSPVQASAVPAGATAKCRDGAYSFSQHRSGTCSGHGGVAEWL